MVEIARAHQLGDGDLSRVDEVRVNPLADGGRAHAEHAVLGVEGHLL